MRIQREIIFKIDFDKAYNSIDWGFFKFVMKKMTFNVKWCSWTFRMYLLPYGNVACQSESLSMKNKMKKDKVYWCEWLKQ